MNEGGGGIRFRLTLCQRGCLWFGGLSARVFGIRRHLFKCSAIYSFDLQCISNLNIGGFGAGRVFAFPRLSLVLGEGNMVCELSVVSVRLSSVFSPPWNALGKRWIGFQFPS